MASRNPTLWLLRVAWLLLPLLVGPAVGEALDGRSSPMALVSQAALWSCWAVGLVAVLVPSAVSLTVVRVLAPLGIVAGVLAAVFGASPIFTALACGGALIVTLVVFSAEVGLALVQGSAYGDERRFLLRPPAALLVGPLPLAWALMAGPLVTGTLLLGARQWVAGTVFVAAGALLAVLLAPRLHRLSRRIVVLVPAGLVVRDPLLLADTAMFRRPSVLGISLALVDTTAVDLTGRSLGNAVEIRLRDPGQLVVAGTLQDRQGRSVEVQSFLVAPSRPGRLLTEAACARLPGARTGHGHAAAQHVGVGRVVQHDGLPRRHPALGLGPGDHARRVDGRRAGLAVGADLDQDVVRACAGVGSSTHVSASSETVGTRSSASGPTVTTALGTSTSTT